MGVLLPTRDHRFPLGDPHVATSARFAEASATHHRPAFRRCPVAIVRFAVPDSASPFRGPRPGRAGSKHGLAVAFAVRSFDHLFGLLGLTFRGSIPGYWTVRLPSPSNASGPNSLILPRPNPV